MIKQRREGRGVYIRSYGQLTVMMPFSYERENFFSTIGWMNALYSLFGKNKIFVDMLMDDNW